ncbi:fasciclin domain-containing protein [Aquimarina sp. MMG015]|uniref:fasciclin domain-containing protein n=1 Tax=Aquimarina TaxID=290174 RepID=UPI00041619C2|nr:MULTISPECIES: fasciclin domain-containing protein [Aquimarina]AXT54562.1 fasciclin domain-containing protein [Aquimarina sp. AD1]MBQ4804586.1 fasciclin domain-containing protein [Aquimarina sp. MMG015]RKN13953.1 fasciclin domain-containing protein [Aquimarina sp. AD1]
MKKLIFITSTLFLFVVSQSMFAQSKKDIVDVAASVDDFSTLVTAVKAADLVGALKGDGPFTVFAPTNDAFAKIDSKTLNSLLEPANKAKLTSILTYHVVSGKIDAGAVVKALKSGGGKAELTTLNGAKLKVLKKDGKIWLKDQNGNYSQIVKTDVMASNGVIHVIGDVVMPK